MSKLKKPRVKRGSPRAVAFTRLSEYYKYRSRSENAPDDLTLAMQGQPHITTGLKEAPGGIDAVINALRAFDNPDAQSFIALYDSFGKVDHDWLSLEEFAVASDIGSSRLLGLAVEALAAYGRSVSQVILWAGMPTLVKRATERALTKNGIEDTNMLFKAASFIPTPRGPSFAVQVNNQLPEPKEESRPWDPEAQLRGIQAAWGESKALPPVQPEHEPLAPTLESLHDHTADVLDAD